MRIVIPSVQVPFIRGGAEVMTKGLCEALKDKGHDIEIVTIPYKFFPEKYVSSLMDFCLGLDFDSFSGYSVDRIIVLQFPAYYVKHEHKSIWLMHQHRAVYDAYDGESASADLKGLREKVIHTDTQELSKMRKIYSMSQNITNRLKRYNHIDSIPLYHPPFGEERFYCEEPYNYIFYPSRLEAHKRQGLLIQAMQYTKTPVKAILSGTGGQLPRLQQLIESLGLNDRVKMIGYITEDEKYAYYARSLAVFFGPHDEDYGYVTLEAMLSQKPVVTCTDSGGPLEFIADGENGFIVGPEPRGIAEKIDWFYHYKQKAHQMGKNGLDLYWSKNIRWDYVADRLLSAAVKY